MPQNWWHQMMSQVKDTQASQIMMIMATNLNMIWVEKSLEVEYLKRKKTCRYFVQYVLENIQRPIVQISNTLVLNNLPVLEITLPMQQITNKMDHLLITDMKTINTSMDLSSDVSILTTVIIAEVIVIITTIKTATIDEAIVTIITTIAIIKITIITIKKVLNNITHGVHKKERNILTCSQQDIIVHRIITNSKSLATTITKIVMGIISEQIWIWNTKINPIVILSHTTHIIKDNQEVIQTVTTNIDTVDDPPILVNKIFKNFETQNENECKCIISQIT